MVAAHTGKAWHGGRIPRNIASWRIGHGRSCYDWTAGAVGEAWNNNGLLLVRLGVHQFSKKGRKLKPQLLRWREGREVVAFLPFNFPPNFLPPPQ